MTEKFKNKYRKKSLRIQGYDYSQNGAYFVTICTKDKINYFGKIKNGEMVLSDIGNIVQKYWQEISNQFSFVQLDEFVIMPNHVHGIIIINMDVGENTTGCRDAINRVSTNNGGVTGKNNPMMHNSISRFIRWYKGRCTFEIKKLHKNAMNRVSTNHDFAWQSRFYDRIIRDDVELNKIREYIQINPREWDYDKDNIDNSEIT
ncbi:MAG: transposase [Candidatus Moraniibacteriota bacterium]|jgi:REP-associated tyrosine transposase